MLPTTGFFKDIDCPYYEKSCARPYCHFRHRKRSQEPPSPTEVPTYKPTPKSELASTKSHIPISYVPDLVIRSERSSRIYNLSERPTYKPTPISFLSTQNVSKVCEYKPINVSLDAESKEEIDLADLSTEFDLIDEILEDDSGDSTKQYTKTEETCSELNNESSDKNKQEEKSGDKNKDDKKRSKEDGNGKYKYKEDDRKQKYSRSKSENKAKDKEREKSRNRDKEKLQDCDKKERSSRNKTKPDCEDEKSESYTKEHCANLKNSDIHNSDSENKVDFDSDDNEHHSNKNKKRSSESSSENEDKHKSKKSHEREERKSRDKPKVSEKERGRSDKHKNQIETTKKVEDSDSENKDKHRKSESKSKSRNSEQESTDKRDRSKAKNRERDGESSERESKKSDRQKSRNTDDKHKSGERDSKKRNRDSEKSSDRDGKKKSDDGKKRNYESDDKSSDRDNKKKTHNEDGNKKKVDRDRKSSESEAKNKDGDRDVKKKNRERDKSSERDDKKSRTRDNKSRHDRDKRESKDRHKNHDKRAKNKSETEQYSLTNSEQHKLSESEQMDFDDAMNFDMYGEDEEVEMDSIEAECYKIFNEYTPPVIEEKYEPVSIKSPESEPVPYNPTCKKRIAYEKASETVPKVTYNKKVISNASMAMLNRLKMARQAQANNDYKDLLTELNEQKMNLKRKATESAHSQNKRFDGSDVNSQKTNFSVPSSKHSLTSSSKLNASSSTLSKQNPYLKSNHKSNELPAKNPVSLVDEIISGRSVSNNKPKRIAPVQNVGLIQRAKAQFDEMVKIKAAQVLKTQAQTTGKGNKRVAHIPDASLSDLPDVLNAVRSKLPVNVRTRYLTMLADECVKLYVFKDDAYQRALNEELKCYEKCSVLGTYRNSAMLAINRLRKEIQERENSGLGPMQPGETNGGGDGSQMQGKRLYQGIESYLLTEDELVLHGYPREGPVPGRALITSEPRGVVHNMDDNQRTCCRCHKVYLVDDDGMPLVSEDCVYHPLRKRTLRGERTYLCCKSTDDTGCAMSNTHVSEANPDRVLEGYQSTMDPESDNDARSSAVYALDCEMCYTTIGLELTRVTIVDTNLKTVYESLVKPLNPIIDYNTRFSGITEDQMERTSTSILQVQANILHLCNSKTILIGHSLESDMKALKIIHSNIIDTSVMFPHKFGLPHKRALRVLASEYLRKIIQNSTDGHDSAEDALACMELVLWKAKEDMKLKGTK